MKRPILIVLISCGLGAVIIAGHLVFRGYLAPGPAVPKLQLQLARKMDVGAGVYPGIVSANDHFYVSYESNKSIFVKVYDENFTLEDTHQLTANEGADHQLVWGDGYFYLVNSFYLRKFDVNWQELQRVSVIEDLPDDAGQDVTPEEGWDDMLLYFSDGAPYLGKGFSSLPQVKVEKEKEKPDASDNLYLRRYDTDLNLVKEIALKDLGNVPGSSLLFRNDIFLVVTADRHWNDSSLIVSRFDRNWSFLDRRTISAMAKANEEFAMGFLEKDGHYFVGYMQITGDLAPPKFGKEFLHSDVILKVFDSDWRLVDEEEVSEMAKEVNTGHMGRPHLAAVAGKIYVAYDTIQDKNPEVWVKEYQVVGE